MRDGEERFYLVSSGAAERYDGDYLAKNLPADGGVRLDNLTTSHATLVVAGPRARDVMSKITEADLYTGSFPWLTGQHTHVGLAPVRLMRINFLGELGWEIHHPVEYQRHIFLELLRAGGEFDIGQCGMRAMDSLRIEKSYRMWAQDLTREYTILEAGLGRFAALDKGDFIGREALVRQRAEGVPREFVTLEVDGTSTMPIRSATSRYGAAPPWWAARPPAPAVISSASRLPSATSTPAMAMSGPSSK